MRALARGGFVKPPASWVVHLALLAVFPLLTWAGESPSDLSPIALAASAKSPSLYLAAATARELLVWDAARSEVSQRLPLPGVVSGMTLSPDETRLFLTCAGPVSQVCILDLAANRIVRTLSAGHTALGPVVSSDGRTLYVCNRFNNAVSVFDLESGRESARIPVVREPVSALLTPDGRFLLVANHLPGGRSDVAYVAATVSVIEVASRRVVKELRLPNGSINLRQLCVSPDGRYAGVPHNIGRFQVPVTHINRGWVNTSAFTLVDLRAMEVLNTVLLDDPDRGAANPWAASWSPDSRWLCITHAGSHELSVIDFPALLKKLAALPTQPPAQPVANRDVSSTWSGDVQNDLSFLYGLRSRVKLKGNGPRAVALRGNLAYVASYFSDTLEVIELAAKPRLTQTIFLHAKTNGPTASKQRLGEMYFNDASICFQGWQSCASCHDDDGRVDGLNWDLLNDGIGNPKDTKSLVWSHRTPPVMSLGIRATAQLAVRSGIHNSLASSVPEEIASAMDGWLASLEPAPSPYLVNGQLSEAARRGEKIFMSSEASCSDCHEPPLFTNLQNYRVGTHNAFDKGIVDLDTPTLRELWRTGPYLHDGSAATLREVVTTRNAQDEHGKTSHLNARQIDDLVEYLLSL